MKTINFGIDLGTTNSVIAKAEGGRIELFRNPITHRETLPSVVGFRKGRILVGQKAREYLERDPENVVGTFKRKMGTSERYSIASLEKDVSPVELSAEVLKELKNFVHTGEEVEATVITIPASFDTIQSNATKEAGYKAGFAHVVLLQEPVAASLAYVNKNEDDDEILDGQWLVYDLGGGTFDVALVRIEDGDMRVVDHEGNNFLGGTDFDALIVERLIVPEMYKQGKFENLEQSLKSASGKYNSLFFRLMHKAEAAKIELSATEETEIEFEVEDESGEELDMVVTIRRADFERLILPYITDTVSMIHNILARNDVGPDDLRFVLMIGGSTLIPKVREKIGNDLGLPVNCNIDPTNAVAVGAAHYAATRTYNKGISLEKTYSGEDGGRNVDVKFAYQKTSQEPEEYFVAQFSGTINDLMYRIVREDGGFDSGLKMVQARVEEDLPLVENTFNYFQFTVYDRQGNTVLGNLPTIGIAHGKFSVTGQPLPNDICLEVDDVENETTRLELIFAKNDILPLRRTLTKEVTRTIQQGAKDKVVINVLEGPESALPTVNQQIGIIAVTGEELDRDLIKGSDIEITVEISESRDLRITTYLLMTDQEFMDVFTASERTVHLGKLIDELTQLVNQAAYEWAKIEDQEEGELAEKIGEIHIQLEALLARAQALTEDDVTDTKFQLDDQKRKLAQALSNLTRESAITDLKLDFFSAKRYCRTMVEAQGTDYEKKSFEEILAGEKVMLKHNNVHQIKDATARLRDLASTIRWRDPEYLKWLFYNHYNDGRDDYLDKEKSAALIVSGVTAANNDDVSTLQHVINALWELLPRRSKTGFTKGTGIG